MPPAPLPSPVASAVPAVLAVGLWLPDCADLDSELGDALDSLGALADLAPTRAPAHTPAIPPAALPRAPRLGALSDQAFATHPFTVPWVNPPLQVTLFLPPDSTRGPELAVGFERSLRGLAERWPGAPCQPARAIDVYFVDPHLIEDRRRFDLGPNQPDGELWGVYSPWGGQHGVVAITLRDLPPDTVATVLGHELAHHWHHRLCMDGSSEAFAQAYEALDWPHAVSRGGPTVPAATPPTATDPWPAAVAGAEPVPARHLGKKARRRQRRAARRTRRRR